MFISSAGSKVRTTSEKTFILQLLQPRHFYMWSNIGPELWRWHLCSWLSNWSGGWHYLGCFAALIRHFWELLIRRAVVSVVCDDANVHPHHIVQWLLFNAKGHHLIFTMFKNAAQFCLNGSSSVSKSYSHESKWEFFLWLSQNPDLASHECRSVTLLSLSSLSYCDFFFLGIRLVNSHLTEYLSEVPQQDWNISCGYRIRFNILQSECHSP